MRDNRPKRRKYKDNPYTIKYDEKLNKYSVAFFDSKGIKQSIEISYELYCLFDRFELDDLSELNEYDRHIEHVEHTDDIIEQHKYIYNNSNWEDQLTYYDDKSITYDEIGNPLTIGSDITLSWINGRQLNSYIDLNNNITYKYNKDGIRIKKVVNNVETEYYVEGSKVSVKKFRINNYILSSYMN